MVNYNLMLEIDSKFLINVSSEEYSQIKEELMNLLESHKIKTTSIKLGKKN